MYEYRAYGLRIRSAYELPALPGAEGEGDSDVAISQGSVTPVPSSVEGVGIRRIRAQRNRCKLTYDGIGTFLVESGERVVFDPASSEATDRGLFPRLLKNEIPGVLMFQRGHLVLHASAVAVGDRAGVFLGPRGAGKSTTATAFHRRGHPVLEDDVVAINVADDRAFVRPGVPQLRVRPDAADGLGIQSDTVPVSDDQTDKRYHAVGPVSEPVQLGGCYVLQDGESVELDPITGHDRFLELISQTYTQGLLSDAEMTPSHFQQCSTIASEYRFTRVRRPRDLDRLPTLVDIVSDDLRSTSTNSD